MTRAIDLADVAAAAGDVPVGAILVADGRAFEAHNEKEARRDPTAHAELLALRAAAAALGRWRVGGTLYVTKEPCAMCAGAIAAARVERLVYGCSDPKGGAAGSVIDVLASAAVNHRVDVSAGILADATATQLRAFFAKRRPEGTPPPGTDIQGSRPLDGASTHRGEVVEWLKAPASKAGERL